jgi:uncharacterized protein (DUF2141 family)
MKKTIIAFFLLGISFFSFAQKSNFILTVSNIKPQSGYIRVAIHVKDNFLKKKYYATQVIATTTATQKVEFYLPKGTYAAAVYQDFNNNDNLDKNMLGIPQEPYAFSKGIRPQFRAPTFDEAKFIIQEETVQMDFNLKSW